MREKALAAYRAGFKVMLYPSANQKDLDEVPRDVRKHLQLVPVETMDDVFAVALHRVVAARHVASNFVIEFEDDDGDDGEGTGAEA